MTEQRFYGLSGLLSLSPGFAEPAGPNGVADLPPPLPPWTAALVSLLAASLSKPFLRRLHSAV